ncbi:MAG: hypothetical protein JSW00_03630 [Thermoplasmata archaeon]|nr:MAG: hypothetical protein JSW00_03630 [Thermoplasmata archaeon]
MNLKDSQQKLKETPQKIIKYNVYDKNFVASYVLRILLIIFLIISIWRKDWLWVIGCGFAILLGFIPTILKHDFNITLPWVLDLMISIVIFLHVGGVIFNLYGIIPGYDTITHFVASILVGFLAFIIIYILHEHWDGLHMDLYAMAFLVVIFAMAMGVVWEFFEWGTDLLFGTHEQWGLQDTMKDLLVDTIAGIVIAIIGVKLVQRGELKKLTEELGEQIDESIIKRFDTQS